MSKMLRISKMSKNVKNVKKFQKCQKCQSCGKIKNSNIQLFNLLHPPNIDWTHCPTLDPNPIQP